MEGFGLQDVEAAQEPTENDEEDEGEDFGEAFFHFFAAPRFWGARGGGGVFQEDGIFLVFGNTRLLPRVGDD